MKTWTLFAVFMAVVANMIGATPSSATPITWDNQSLVFDYYFPTYGQVFTGSPVNFVADGAPYLSTFANLSPATFSVSYVSPFEEQIGYTYPLADYPNGLSLTNAPFNGFSISGPAGDDPILSVLVDASSTVTGLTISDLSFTNNSATVNLAGAVFPPGSVGLIDVYFVPEPSSIALFAPALLVAFVIARLRRRRQAC